MCFSIPFIKLILPRSKIPFNATFHYKSPGCGSLEQLEATKRSYTSLKRVRFNDDSRCMNFINIWLKRCGINAFFKYILLQIIFILIMELRCN